MKRVVATIDGNAKPPLVVHFGDYRSPLRWMEDVVAVAKALWGQKTDQKLVGITGVSERSAEAWLSLQTQMSADAVVALLKSEEGFDFLQAIIGTSRPKWWKQFRRRVRRQQLRDRLKQIQYELELVDSSDED